MDSLHVGLHDPSDAADFGCLPDFIHCGLSLPATIAESLDRDIKPDLISVLETVRYCFGSAEYLGRHAFNFLREDTVFKRDLRKAHDAKRWMIGARHAGSLADGDPDF